MSADVRVLPVSEQGEIASAALTLMLLGACGIAAQTLLLRGLLVLGGGNEFGLGITLGGWVLAEAIGVVAASRCRLLKNDPMSVFITATALFCWAFPLALSIARSWKWLAGLHADAGIGLLQLTFASLAVLSLPAILHGILFVAGCALYGTVTGQMATSAGSGYMLEMLGTLLGGLLVTFCLIPLFSPFQAAALMMLSGPLSLLWLFLREKRKTNFSLLALLLLTFAAGLFMLFDGAGRLEKHSLGRQWQGKELLAAVNSPYQQLAVIRNGEQLTFYSDGVPLFPLPDPDITRIEELVHFPMLTHPAPRRILVLGGGAGGVIAELLKYPTVTRVDYLEPDPWLLRLVARFPAPLTTRELSDPRVRVHDIDARHFVRHSRDAYDLILMGAPLPLTLQGNRLFTVEFYRAAGKLLTDDGLLAVPAAGSSTYYGAELERTNATLLATLRAAFPAVDLLPGDENLYLAGRGRIELNSATLVKRLAERRPELLLITPEHLTQRLEPVAKEWFAGAVGQKPATVNRDSNPRLLLWHLGYRSGQFDPQLKPLIAWMGQLQGGNGLVAALALALGSLVIGRASRYGIPMSIAVTGFSGMLLEIVLISIWQVEKGAMYQDLALLITAFMGGMACGSWLGNRTIERGLDPLKLFCLGEVGILLSGLLVIGVSLFSDRLLNSFSSPELLVLLLLPLVGLVAGAQYPLAVRLAAGSSGTTVSSTGTIYSADLVGAWLGGIIGGTLLLPALGVVPACLVVVLLKAGTLGGMVRIRGVLPARY